MLSARQWKPGDVARVGVHRWMRVEGDRWVNELGSFIHGTAHVSIHYACRPLVVIDPEDRDQVEALWVAFRDEDQTALGHDAMQAALRSLANPEPPKPAEPKGLGAVVEDAKGRRFTKVGHNTGTWVEDGNGLEGHLFDDFDAVRVLSEGVTT